MTPFEQDVLTALNAHMECYGFVWNGQSSEHLAHDVAAAIEDAIKWSHLYPVGTEFEEMSGDQRLTFLAEQGRVAALTALRED